MTIKVLEKKDTSFQDMLKESLKIIELLKNKKSYYDKELDNRIIRHNEKKYCDESD